MSKRDYYEVLGIERSADLDAIKKAYRKLAVQYHPDKNPGDARAEESFKEVNEAYEVLKNPEKRAAYDRFGHAGVDPSQAATGGYGGFGGFDLGDALRAFMREFGGFDFFGGETNPAPGRDRRGENRQIRLALTLEEISTGATKKMRVHKRVPCTACNGRGSSSGATEACSTCGGTGQVRRIQRSIFGQMVNVSACPQCRGEGEIVRDPCSVCGGDGRVDGTGTVTVEIPPGVMEGNYMTMAGEGDAGIRGGRPGDLVVVFTEKKHDMFQRHGTDVIYVLPVHPHQAALGASLEVPTLSGKVRMEVPAGLQSGKTLRLRGKGLPGLGGRSGGDQLVHIVVITPSRLGSRERKAWEDLARAAGSEPPKLQKGFFDRMRETFGG